MTEIDITRLERLEHRTDDPQAPEVFFTPIITPDSLIAVYHALGATPEGKVAIKIHSGESEKSNNLNPSLVKDLVQEIGGTLVECATAYDGNRETPEKSLNVFKERGYGDIAPIQIMDMGGEIEIPVAKYKHIPYDIVGMHVDDYDSFFVLSHFKGHPMGGFGGALKNVSIGIASSNGKRWIHSAGRVKDRWIDTPQDDFLESMAEADEAVISHMHGNMMYLNVMNRLSVDCDCFATPSEPDMHDIGVLSSLDPVALDQACVDLIHVAPDGASVTERIATRHGEHTLEYAEELGIGSRAYRLTVLE